MKPISKSRQHLLSTAGTVLALLLAVAPAHAQQASPEASGSSVLVNDQSASGFTHADASTPGAGTVITGSMIDSTVSARDNALAANARANRATLLLAPDPLGTSAAFDTPVLTTGSGGVAGRAGTVIASRQVMTAAEVDADILDTTLRLEAGVVSRSALELSDNTGDTLALGNDVVAEIRLEGPRSGTTAGTTSEQRMGPGSDVTARAWSGTDLATLAVARTSLANSGNLARSVARGNASDNRLVAEVSTLAENPAVEAPSLVSSSGDAEVTALFAVLASQTASGVVRAMAGNRLGEPVFGTTVNGAADVAAITSDGNALGAAAYGNSSTNALDLKVGSITTSPASVDLPNFAIANVTGVQRSDALVIAQTLGGTDIEVSGTPNTSNISASSNSTRTTATTNLASGNLMVESNSAGPNAFAAQVPGGRVDGAGMMEFWSPLGVQNAQASSGAVSASHSGGTRVAIGGSLQQSALRVEDNEQLVAATGNAATNGARVDAVQLGTAVGVSSYQTGDGDVRATLGSALARSDASIIGGLVRRSDLAVSGNDATGIATGNSVSNAVTVESSAIGPGTARWLNSTAYANALGAYAGTALASTQRLGTAAGSEGPLRVVSSGVTGGAAISGGVIAESSLAVDGNTQRAEALGNLASNRIRVSTASYTGYAGSALSSSQVARAAVGAVSDASFEATGTLSGTSASISGNTNLALAEMNDADNAIGVETVHATGSLPYAAIDGSGRAVIGDQVLDSWQQAQGSVQAIATARFEAEGLGLSGTTLEIDSNMNSAEASANRAVNQSSITAAVTVPVSGLANAQSNSATVGASARTFAGVMPGGGIGASSLTVSDNTTSAIARGNSSDNLLTAESPIGSAAVTSTVAGIGGRVEAPAAVLNRQVNNGAVLATALDSGYGLLPGSAPATSVGNIAITGNSVAAAAYGNVASNIINAPGLGQPPAGAIANFQTNSGPVNALVGRTSLGGGAGTFSGSGLSITGNSLAATAVGNQASSAIVGPR